MNQNWQNVDHGRNWEGEGGTISPQLKYKLPLDKILPVGCLFRTLQLVFSSSIRSFASHLCRKQKKGNSGFRKETGIKRME